MIQFSARVQALMENPNVQAFHMVRVHDYRTTTHYGDITLSDGQTFLADGRVVSVDQPQMSSTVDREQFKVSFDDADFTMNVLIPIGMIGKDFEVWIGFIDPETEEPLTDINDTILVYSGIVDEPNYSIETGSTGRVTYSISGSSPMADLDSTRSFRTSRDFLRNINPDDSAFDQIYEGSGPVNLKWGKG